MLAAVWSPKRRPFTVLRVQGVCLFTNDVHFFNLVCYGFGLPPHSRTYKHNSVALMPFLPYLYAPLIACIRLQKIRSARDVPYFCKASLFLF